MEATNDGQRSSQDSPAPIPQIKLEAVTCDNDCDASAQSNGEQHGEEEFFDATDEMPASLSSSEQTQQLEAISPSISVLSFEGDPPEIEEDKDFRELNSTEGLMQSNKSIVLQLLSQIRIGMDLTRIVLPAFIFEKRSLLEMYAEFFSRPDIIIRAASLESPLDRIVEITKWLLSSLSASRTVGMPKKPYNPVLGEVFCCYWDVPGGKRTPSNIREKRLLDGGPPIQAGFDSMTFLAEQVSHHPPVTAFYAECPSKRIYLTSTVESKTRFQGLSVKVQNSGSYELHFMDRNEIYVGTFPNGYVRSLLTTPWFEFGGPATITCKETGYTCNMDFHTKPFRGGHKHKVSAEIRHTSRSKAVQKLEGFWTNVISKKVSKNVTEPFMDVRMMPTIRKKVKKFSHQEPNESRIVWRHLTSALEREDSEAASRAKHEVEEAQREKAREFKLTGLVWEAKHFRDIGTKNNATFWKYKNTLRERIDQINS